VLGLLDRRRRAIGFAHRIGNERRNGGTLSSASPSGFKPKHVGDVSGQIQGCSHQLWFYALTGDCQPVIKREIWLKVIGYNLVRGSRGTDTVLKNKKVPVRLPVLTIKAAVAWKIRTTSGECVAQMTWLA
jgi:hypothetical protein